MPPELPVTVSVFEVGVEAVVAIVSVEVITLPAGGVTEAGLNVHVVPAGHSTLNATAWLNPFNDDTVMVATADEPWFTGEGARGVDPRVKSCAAACELQPKMKFINTRTISRPITLSL
jgi:hypothetical protein